MSGTEKVTSAPKYETTTEKSLVKVMTASLI